MKLSGIVYLVFFVLGVTTSFVTISPQHGCAPLTPPTVPGTLIQPPATRGILFINEVLLVPHLVWNCSTSSTSPSVDNPWVEIYNPQDQAFDLYAVHAKLDSGPDTDAFYLPFGAAIAPHSYLVVFPSTGFFFRQKETLMLRLVIGTIAIDQVTLPILGSDMSYARIPDGGTTWQITSTPTIDTSNGQVQATPKSHKGSANSGQNSVRSHNANTTTGGSNQQKIIDGVQPAWNKVQLPTNVPSPTITTTPTAKSSLPTSNSSMDIPGKILWTVVSIALALLCCRWLLTQR